MAQGNESDQKGTMRTKILRNTVSVCPECFRSIPARVSQRQGKVWLEKTCPEHGDFELLLSNHGSCFSELSEFYFSVIDRTNPQRDYIVHLTNRCNLDCPICLADANCRQLQDYPLTDLKLFLKGKRGYKIDLMGAEPTVRDDLAEIIHAVKNSGNIPALHSNGLALADLDYLKKLKQAGLKEVHLQFDGFDDKVYETIRGKKLLAVKLRTLENLDRLNLATNLVVTVVRGVNEQEMGPVLEYGMGHDFVKEVFFLGCRFLGKARELQFSSCMMPDELIDIISEQTKGAVSREDVKVFQKLYFALLSVFSIRKCFYIQHYLVFRQKERICPISDLIDFTRLETILDDYRDQRKAGKAFASVRLLLALTGLLLWAGPALFREFFAYGIPFVRGFDLSRLPARSILIGFISACDPYSYDEEIARNCGKGAVSRETGVQDSGALDNVIRDKLFRGFR